MKVDKAIHEFQTSGNILDIEGYCDEFALHDADIPWWAVALTHHRTDTAEYRVKHMVLDRGYRTQLRSAAFWQAWNNVVQQARKLVMTKSLDEWRDVCFNNIDPTTGQPNAAARLIQSAALRSPRSFAMFAELKDPAGKQIILKGFHTQTVNALRQRRHALALLPYEHGKSWLSSQLIPLMDWAEYPNATEGRIYLDPDTIRKWVPLLKQIVEHNDALHKMFPWIRKPRKGDASRIWNETSFSIGGRTLADASFKALTIKSERMGQRFHRTIIDDVVTSSESESAMVQEKFWRYILTGAMTFGVTESRESAYGTQWPSVGIVGTIFSPFDVNSRAGEHFQTLRKIEGNEKEYKFLRFDIYPRGERWAKTTVLWPEVKGPEEVKAMKQRLGDRAFLMRCRNMVHLEGVQMFPEPVVRSREADGEDGKAVYTFGVPPENCNLMIGFDPASGKLTRGAADPAIVLYGMRNLGHTYTLGPFATQAEKDAAMADWAHHLIRWERLPGYSFPRKCDKLIEWARQYRCVIAVEDNNQQIDYQDQIHKVAKDVTVVLHHTGNNKRDPNDGVDQFEPLFKNERITIHAAGAPQEELLALRKQFVQWPKGKPNDLVMAAWFARAKLSDKVENRDQPVVKTQLPWYARPRHQRYAPNRVHLQGRH